MKTKNLKILLAISAIFVMVFSVFSSFAANTEEPYKTEEKDVVIKNNDVVIDYNVEGNLVVFAKNVTVKEGKEIRGDAVIFADTVTFEPNSYVLSNLVVASNTLNLKGTTYTLYAAVNNINVEGYVYRDMKVCAGDKVSILGTVGRDAVIAGTSNITFKSNEEDDSTKGLIAGKLTYYSQNKATSDFGDSVDKEKVTHISIVPVSVTTSTSNYVWSFLYALVNYLVVLAILAIVFKKLTPKFVETAERTYKEKKYSSLLLGLGLLVLAPALIFALLFTVVGANLALLAFVLYLLLIYLATPISLIGLTGFLANKLDIKTTGKRILVLLGLATILKLINLIPYFGLVVSILIGLAGLGIIVAHIIEMFRSPKHLEPISVSVSEKPVKKEAKTAVASKAETKVTPKKATSKSTTKRSTTKASTAKKTTNTAATKKAATPTTKKTATKKTTTPAKKTTSTAKKTSNASKKTNTKKK